jgi:hypothetical protein
LGAIADTLTPSVRTDVDSSAGSSRGSNAQNMAEAAAFRGVNMTTFGAGSGNTDSIEGETRVAVSLNRQYRVDASPIT